MLTKRVVGADRTDQGRCVNDDSVGGAFAFAALAALADAAAEIRDQGTYCYLAHSAAGWRAVGRAAGTTG